MAAGLQSSIWNNNIRSIILLALYPIIIMGMVWLIAYAVAYNQGGMNMNHPEYAANTILLEYWPIILTVIGGWFLISWFMNTSMIRALSHAKKIERTEEPELYNLLENLCIAEGMTMPQLNIIETPAMNAFASGVDERSYAITVTRGLMDSLEKDELEAVLGHELTHIINRDVRLLMVTVVFTGMVGLAAQLVWSSVRHGLYRMGRSSDRKGGGILLVLIIGVILWIGYMATLFTRFALSRRREYMADAGSVQITKNPDAMMRALIKIAGMDKIPETTEDVRMMCIENAQPFLGLFATHPPIAARIDTISQMTNTPVPAIMPAAPPARNPWLRAGKGQ
jgi:heat shock protein HtpX